MAGIGAAHRPVSSSPWRCKRCAIMYFTYHGLQKRNRGAADEHAPASAGAAAAAPHIAAADAAPATAAGATTASGGGIDIGAQIGGDASGGGGAAIARAAKKQRISKLWPVEFRQLLLRCGTLRVWFADPTGYGN